MEQKNKKKLFSLSDQKRAICVAHSWLSSWGLESIPLVDGCLMVEGKRVDLTVSGKHADISLDGRKLIGRDVDQTIAECKRVSDLCGKATPPKPRKTMGTIRAKKGDYEGISMRLTPFERTSNPKESEIKKWEPIVRRERDIAYRRYRQLCKTFVMDRDDLYSIGLVYLCIYLHRHRCLTSSKIDGGLLTLFLRQEYSRWAKVTTEKLKRVKVDMSGLPLDILIGTPATSVEICGSTNKVVFYQPKETE
jgi:hypothetical protein